MSIRKIAEKDKNIILEMMTIFYNSPAGHTNGSAEIFENDFNACVSDNPYLDGYVICDGEVIQGYFMLAKSFSTEFGKPCVWLEDIYVLEQYRNLGLGSKILEFISEKYKNCIIRLEVEKDNDRAIYVYKKAGFEPLSYLEMIKFN